MNSKYAETLNALCEMQQSPIYAVRRSALCSAEKAIVSLETQVNELVEALKDVRSGLYKTKFTADLENVANGITAAIAKVQP